MLLLAPHAGKIMLTPIYKIQNEKIPAFFIYGNQSDINRLDALKFLHCQPVVDQFEGSDEDLALLDSVLYNALNSISKIEFFVLFHVWYLWGINCYQC